MEKSNGGVQVAAIIGISIVVAVGLAGAVLITALDKDAAPFINTLTTTLAILAGAIGTILGVNKNLKDIKDDQEKIKKSVNGYTSELLSKIDTGSLSADEIAKIEEIRAHNESLTRGGGRHVAQ